MLGQRVTDVDDDPGRPLGDLMGSGLLWLINATTFHPRGLAFTVHVWDARPDVYAMLPKAYFAVLNAALRADDIYPADVYEADAGIGYQRGTCRSVRESFAA